MKIKVQNLMGQCKVWFQHNKKGMAVLCLLLAVLLSYGNSLGGSFIWDDNVLIVKNPLILESADRFSKVFATHMYPGTQTNYYRPLVILSFLVNHLFSGFCPFWYHLTNILLQAACGIILFFILEDITKKIFVAFAASLLFVVHPIHTEVVAYISGRADILMLLFILSALLFYRKAVSPESFKALNRPIRHSYFYVFSLLCFVFALLSKELSFILPMVILGTELILERAETKTRPYLNRLGSFFALALIYGVLRLTILNFSGGNPFLSKKGFAILDVGLWERFIIFLKTLVIYMGNIPFPMDLHLERFTSFEPIYFLHVVGFLLMGALVFYLIFRLRDQEKKLITFSIFWFFIWFIPQSAFVWPRLMADHFLYLPSIGLFLMMALFLDRFKTVWKIGSLTGIALFFSIMALVVNRQWQDEMIFFRRLSRLAPHSYKAHDFLAGMYFKNGQTKEALLEYQRISDPDGLFLSERKFNIFAGRVLARPIKESEKPINAAAFCNMGVVLMSEGRDEEALCAFENAIKLNPATTAAYNNSGILLEKKGLVGEAENAYLKAIALDKEFVSAYNNLGQLYAKQGNYQKALGFLEQALTIRPGYKIAQANINSIREILKK